MESVKPPIPDLAITHAADTKKSEPEAGLLRLVGAYNDKLFVAEHRMEKGWVGAKHSHPHEQAAYVVSGHIRLTSAGQNVDLRAGDSFVVRGGVEHQAEALEPSVVVDVFTPCREDYK